LSEGQRKKLERIDEIRKRYDGCQGGIFWQKTREKIVTKEGIYESSPAKNTFWYRQRESVKTALIDINLFLEEAEEKDVDRVFTRDSLEPLLQNLLPLLEEPNPNRAKIASLLIRTGFDYLRTYARFDITRKQDQEVNEALELARHLTAFLLPENERIHYRIGGI